MTESRRYLERGEPVEVVTRFALPSKKRPLPPNPPWLLWAQPPKGTPRNVAIRRSTGEIVVRPFRGLRRIEAARGQ